MKKVRIVWFMLGLCCLLAACSFAKKPEHVGSDRDIRYDSVHTDVPLLADLGGYHHAISTQHPLVQRLFNQGMVMSFAYNHTESIRAFRAAQKLDQYCAMCYWGEALALGPNLNVTSNGQVVLSEEAHLQAYAAIQKALNLLPNASEKERNYIKALSVRYSDDQSIARSVLDHAYLQAMRNLWRNYPADDDVAAMLAEAMMNTMPWDYWVTPEIPKALTVEVIDVLETVLQNSSRHPLALHLYIHAVEASSTPERAEKAADLLHDLIPGAGHLVHMPSHIYWRIGRYHDASEANAKAAATDEAYMAACKMPSFYTAVYYPHNLHFLWASYSMEGKSQAAIETAHKVAASVSLEMIENYPTVEFFKTIPLLAYVQFGQWREVLMQPSPSIHLPFSRGIWHYARALAHTKLGDPGAAQADYVALVAILETADLTLLDTQDYPATKLLQIADQLVQGEMQRDPLQSIAFFKQAVTLQEQLPYTEPPFWYYPIQLSLGKALLTMGNAVEAEAVYRDNLRHYPKNGWALFGLMQSLEMQNKKINSVKKEFNEAWQYADVELTASRF